MSKHIDQLVEKFLTTGKFMTTYFEVFENPNKHEINKEFNNNTRFIADIKRKRIYMWDSNLSTHEQAWDAIKDDLKDNRNLFETDTLLCGTNDRWGHSWHSQDGPEESMKKKIRKHDWSFILRYVPVSKEELKKI